MFKSVTRVVSRTSNLSQRHGYRTKMPKTRFSVKDRSMSSPRLKSFPAEKIRRVERSPIRKTSENANSSNQQIIHSGQGDVPADFQNAQLLPFPMGNENLTTTSEQQVRQNVCPMDDRLNRSEVVIPAGGMEKTLIERPQLPSTVQQPSLQHNRQYQQEIPGQTFQQQINNVKADNDGNSKEIQPSMHGNNSNQYGNSSGNWLQQQQNLMQPQNNHQRNLINSQIPQQSMLNDAKSESKQKIDGNKKKPLKFTPAMIRDQEILVMTMKQQGIKEDIMRRQFDALLAEQRKQLLYLEQLENPESSEVRRSSQAPRVKRRITKIEGDGKPEWMLHITPPRIPYSVLEKMQAERQADLPGQMTNDQKIGDTNPGHWSNNRKNQEIYDPNAHAHHHQHPWRMIGPNVHQHQPQYSYVPNNINVPKQHQTCDANGTNSSQYQQRYDDYSIHHQQQSHKQNNDEKIVPKSWQVGGNENETSQHNDHEKSNRNVEPSSLLKLRIYKEVIKRQKQNNGLQDPQTIKEAIEALKNPLNRKGLEYLENLNKKRDKPVVLNGVQDPNEIPTIHQLPSHVCHQPASRGPSANGLENSRNPNNPPPGIISRPKKVDEFYMSEYPRQRATNYPQNCYNLMAERENGSVAVTKNHVENSHGTAGNRVSCLNESQMRNDHPNYRCPGYTQPAIRYSANKLSANYPDPTQFPVRPNEQSRFYAEHTQNRRENAEMPHDRTMCRQDLPREEKSIANQQRDLYDPRKNYGIYEPVTIGGVRYLARKPEYCQKEPSLQHYQANLGKSFNPMIACQ